MSTVQWLALWVLGTIGWHVLLYAVRELGKAWRNEP